MASSGGEQPFTGSNADQFVFFFLYLCQRILFNPIHILVCPFFGIFLVSRDSICLTHWGEPFVADDALEHTFFVHKGYQPSYNYGKDINWQYWPVQDNELRWQLHRHKWFTPMGKAYRISGDEKYAKEWAYQYIDWIKKNPLTEVEKEEYELVSAGEVKGNAENVRFAWRPLEVSNRLQDQTLQFLLFVSSKAFTPEFLTCFLISRFKMLIPLFRHSPASLNSGKNAPAYTIR